MYIYIISINCSLETILTPFAALWFQVCSICDPTCGFGPQRIGFEPQILDPATSLTCTDDMWIGLKNEGRNQSFSGCILDNSYPGWWFGT